jgi:3-deoxy-manno-octulosonate cytidylyltransferase (CMP-KDO synthetase)
MIQHVYEKVVQSPLIWRAAVATDDERIFQAVQGFGGLAVMTAATHRSGTDRIAEAVDKLGEEIGEEDIVVNVQGDQPLFEPIQIAEVVKPLQGDPGVPMSTLIYKITRAEEITHPNAVKVVFDRECYALYFSRSTIPYVRETDRQAEYYKHHGIYAYRRGFLRVFVDLPEGILEKLEALEQLRALEYRYRVKVIVSAYDSVEVDTPAELDRVRKIMEGLA